MEKSVKILYFQYTIHKLLNWYKEVNGNEFNNDLSTLKSLKLLFFVTAARTAINDKDTLVDSVFNNYVAMPYGHVEDDIYNEIKLNNGVLDFFIITNQKTTRKNREISELILKLDQNYISKINESVEYLSSNYKNLISFAPFDLVELSHLWYSWRKNYSLAIKEQTRKRDIPIDDIKIETKVFNLQTYS